MKLKRIAQMLTTGTLAFGATVALAQPSQAQATSFVCENDARNVPTTYAVTPNGYVPVIKWESTHFIGSGYTPANRCQEVTRRFNSFHARGQLEFLSSGWQNGQAVLCAGSRCTGNNLLLTLRSDQDPGQSLQEMIAVGGGGGGPARHARGGGGSGRVVVNLNDYIENTPAERSAPSNTSPRNTQPRNTQPSRPSSGGGGRLW